MAATDTKEKLNTYLWRGIDHKGLKANGELEATSIRVARMMLRQRGVKINQVRKEPTPLFGGAKVKHRDIVVVTRQLATLVEGGIPISESLTAVSNSTDNTATKKLLKKMRTDVESGESLTNVLKLYPKHFSPLFIGLVNVGEESGTLGPMLKRIAVYQEKAEALRAKIKSALAYPVIVLLIGLLITSGLLIFIIPKFQELFSSLGGDLPALTQVVVNASGFLKNNFLIVLLTAIIIFFVHRKLYQTSPAVKLATDKLVLRIPVFGELIRKGILAKIARTIGIMFRAGIPMVETLAIIAPASGNQIYTDALDQVRTDVSTGQPLEVSMKETNVFPSMVLQMVRTGEETGEMDAMLDRAADFYEDEVDNMVASISSLVEPILVVILGSLIGIVVVAMYLPIFNLGSLF